MARPQVLSCSLPPQLEAGWHIEHNGGELSSYPNSPAAVSEPDQDYRLDDERAPLFGSDRERYGTINEENIERYSSRKRKGRRNFVGRRLESTTISSLTRVVDGDDSESEDEKPPMIEMIYKRSGKDLAKLVFLPILYFGLMVVAIIFAFYTIQGLVTSYENKVRSVQSISVNGRFDPVGIAIFPQFSKFESCSYRYYDDLTPHDEDRPIPCDYDIPQTCTMINVTFNSTTFVDVERYAMVFKSPTLVGCKQSILIRYSINTTLREFSAVEYILFDDWGEFERKSLDQKKVFLAGLEKTENIYTFPAGFRTWIKMSYSVANYGSKINSTEFRIIDNYASFNGPSYDVENYPMEVLFQWKDKYFDYINEIVSTTAWSAFGSICGVFITLVKAGEFCRMWIRRIRREKQKKEIHLKKLEEEQKKLLESYEQRQREKKEIKLRKSLEATKTILTSAVPINNT